MEYVCAIVFVISTRFHVFVSLMGQRSHPHRVSDVGVKTTALAGPKHRFCVVSAGETGKACREFPGARAPETPADNTGSSLRARTEVVKQ